MRYITFSTIICFLFIIVFVASCKRDGVSSKAIASKYLLDELNVQEGQNLFITHCANCHNFEENNIGPNLAGITAQVEKEWLVKFIKNPIAVINSGDARATEQFKKYKQYMTPFPQLKEEEINQILGYIHKFSEGEKKNKASRPGALIDPIKEKMAVSDHTLVLKKWLRVPPSADVAPLARINKMIDLKTGDKYRLLVHDLRGKIFELANDSATVFFDVKSQLPNFMDRPGLASGLGSFTFHPDYESNGLMYTVHTEPDSTGLADFALPSGIKVAVQYVLTEWKNNGLTATNFIPASRRELLRIDMNTVIHGVQDIQFNPLVKKGNPDYGMLYIGVGDGGVALAGHPELADNIKHIWSAVIRIDPLGSNSKNGKYGIPADNPYTGTVDAVKEIWARGFRNPHIISWDRSGSDKMFISNIGQHSIEEVNLGKKGADYGWPYREGTFLFDPNANHEVVYPLPANDSDHYTHPVIQYDHDEGNAISAGVVYVGKIKALQGKYIFGDIPRGFLFFAENKDIIPGQQATIKKLQVEMDGVKTDLETITKNTRVDLRIGTDHTGEIYLFSKSNGEVYKVVDMK